MPKMLGGEALLAPGKLGGEPYTLGAGLKIFGEGTRATGSGPKGIGVPLGGV
jgi:hypothetical protein